jgi:hypothetical protein
VETCIIRQQNFPCQPVGRPPTSPLFARVGAARRGARLSPARGPVSGSDCPEPVSPPASSGRSAARRGRGPAANHIHSIHVIDVLAAVGASKCMPSNTTTASASAYKPRCAVEELVYRVVAAELDGFLAEAEAEARGHPLPSFVASTFREFLTCGIPEHGFLRVHCDTCGRDRVVPFSCKRRGVCNSCGGRRMAETAAHLVDRVLPAVPTRQWVLSVPFPLRYRLAYDRDLATPLLAAFLRAVFASLRRRARECHGVRKSKCGAFGPRQLGPHRSCRDSAGL